MTICFLFDMNIIPIKPLSVNAAWKGQRFKSKAYIKYEKNVLFLLPKIVIPEPPFKVTLIYGFSSTRSDIDNPTKMLLDIFTKKYGFDDRLIIELNIKKEKTTKGNEYTKFKIETHHEHI